ncbi:MAG: PAS domain S-box protein, partial [Pseudomonadota bacterium]
DWRIGVFESLSFPTLILRPNKEIVTANQVFLQKYGLSLEEIVGRTCFDFFYKSKYCPRLICPLSQVMTSKTGHSVLQSIVGEEGQEIWEERFCSPILDDEGEVKYIMYSIRDVTRLKSLEKELRETKEFLEKVIHSSPTAIMVADRKGKILVINQAAEKLFGLSSVPNVYDLNVEGLYPPGMARRIMKKLRDPSYGGQGILPSTEIVIINRHGEEIPVEITAAIIYEEGREVATMGIFKDLREKVAVEEKLHQAQLQLAHAEKMASLGQLAAGVAHEINNPLTGILFYASLALERLDQVSPIREDLEYVIEDVHRCKEIVKNLLAYSRRQTTTKTIIQLNDMVNQSLALIRDQKIFGNIEIVREMPEDMMLIHVDKTQLNQVIINLVMNAAAAMNGKGHLTFRTYRNKTAGKVYLEVADTGHGIAEEHLSKIFDPFFTTKEPGKGTGLGLSTAYGIIKEHGGEISVKKTSPQGTTFLVELPLYTPSDQEAG